MFGQSVSKSVSISKPSLQQFREVGPLVHAGALEGVVVVAAGAEVVVAVEVLCHALETVALEPLLGTV